MCRKDMPLEIKCLNTFAVSIVNSITVYTKTTFYEELPKETIISKVSLQKKVFVQILSLSFFFAKLTLKKCWANETNAVRDRVKGCRKTLMK
jgi:hypothetical protein